MTSEIIENKLFYEKEMLKKITSDWTAYYIGPGHDLLLEIISITIAILNATLLRFLTRTAGGFFLSHTV